MKPFGHRASSAKSRAIRSAHCDSIISILSLSVYPLLTLCCSQTGCSMDWMFEFRAHSECKLKIPRKFACCVWPQVLIHVPRVGPQWKDKTDPEIAPPGTYTDGLNWLDVRGTRSYCYVLRSVSAVCTRGIIVPFHIVPRGWGVAVLAEEMCIATTSISRTIAIVRTMFSFHWLLSFYRPCQLMEYIIFCNSDWLQQDARTWMCVYIHHVAFVSVCCLGWPVWHRNKRNCVCQCHPRKLMQKP